MPGIVETSCNLATVTLEQGHLKILVSQRSSSPRGFAEIKATVAAVARLAGAVVSEMSSYPAWQPDLDSELLQRSRQVYQALFQREPVVQVIHAGLECAIIGGLIPGMDMISFGPTIRNPHSPDERLFIPSVEKVWRLLSALLEDLGGQR
jgi:dipeptidase D